MKRLILAGTALLALTACSTPAFLSGTPSAEYDLSFVQTETELQAQLTAESLRVIERRLSLMGEVLQSQTVDATDTGARISISADHEEALEALTQDLTAPFTFAIMREAAEGENADISVEGHGGFVYTDVNEDDIEWVQSREQPGSTKGEVRIVFTEEGRQEMADLFKAHEGESIGMFVRDRLISKLLVDTNELLDDIVIRDIPDAELAQAFAEDVNVGINVTFTPVP